MRRLRVWLGIGLVLSARPAPAVIGGQLAGPRRYAATGAFVDKRLGMVTCTGTLIAPTLVLTAAHCLKGRGGMLSFTLSADPLHVFVEPIYEVAEVYPHPAFTIRPAPGEPMNDIGVAVLRASVRSASPEALPAAAPDIREGAPVTLVGYGPTASVGDLRRVRNVGLASIHRGSAFEALIGGPGANQDCVADSGGPSFVVDGAGRRVLWGVASRAREDADAACRSGTVHTRVDAYLSWIRQVAR